MVARWWRPRFAEFFGALLAATAFSACAAAPPPPVPALADFGPVAAEVKPLLEEGLGSVRQDPRDGARWDRLGMICEANGFETAAINAYRAATVVQPSNAKAWYRLGLAETRAAQSEQAVRDLRRAIEVQATYAPAHWRLGFLLLDANDTAGAEAAFARAREIDPASVAAAVGLARVYLQRHEEQRAVDILKQTLSRHPDDRYAMQLIGRAYKHLGFAAEAEFAQALSSSDAQPDWSDQWSAEIAAFERGFAVRLKTATERFLAKPNAATFAALEQLRAEKPGDAALLTHLGEVYIDARRFDQGIPMLEEAVAKDGQRFEAYVSLASAYLEKNELPKARAAIDRALAIHPTLGRAHEIKGAVLSKAGDKRGALESLQAAVRYDPRSARALIWKGRLELQLARPSDAEESFRRATRQDPTIVEGWLGAADAAIALKALDRAAAAIDQARRFNPSNQAVQDAAQRLSALRR